MNGLDLDDLPRRLTDLADSAGPWDDPMPEIRRRAAQAATADAGAGPDVDSFADVDVDANEIAVADVDAAADHGPIRARPAAARAKRRWWRSVDPFAIASVAAVLLVVVGLGWLVIHGGGGDSSEKSSNIAAGSRADVGSSAAAQASASAGGSYAGHTGRQPSAPVTAPVPTRLPASACGIPGPSGALSLLAPANVRTGAALSVRVRLAGLLAGSVQSREVYVVSRGRVVGRLVPTATRAGPGAVPQAIDAVVTGTLRTSTCAQVTPKPGSHAPARLPGIALAPGRYQLVVVVTTSRVITVSAPVTVTVTR